MNRLKPILAAAFLLLSSYSYADGNDPASETKLDVKTNQNKKPQAPSRISITCRLSDGVLYFGEFPYEFLEVTVTHVASGQTWLGVITPSCREMPAGKAPGLYTITATNEGNQSFYGEINI